MDYRKFEISLHNNIRKILYSSWGAQRKNVKSVRRLQTKPAAIVLPHVYVYGRQYDKNEFNAKVIYVS